MNNIANIDNALKDVLPPRAAPDKIILPHCRLWLTPTERWIKPMVEMTSDEQGRYGPQIENEKSAFYEEFHRHLGRLFKDGEDEENGRKMAQAAERYCADAKEVYRRLINVAKYWEVRIAGDAGSGIIPQLDNLRVAPQFLKEDAAFIERLLSKDPHVIPHVPDAFKKDRNIVMSAVRFSGALLAHMDDELKRDRAIVLAAVGNDGLALKFADAVLREDKEVALAAVRENGLALQYVGEKLKQPEDCEVLMTAIGQNPQAIIYAGEGVIGRRDYFSIPGDEYPSYARDLGEASMMAALAKATPPSGPEIKAHADIILEIAMKSPRILDYFIEGHPLWDDEKFIWGRIGQTNSIPKRIGMKLRNDSRFILTLMEKRSKKLADCQHDSYVLFRYAGGELRGDTEFLEKMLMFRMDVASIANWIEKDDFLVQADPDDIAARR